MNKFPAFFVLRSIILIIHRSYKQDIAIGEVKEIAMEAYIYGFPMVMGCKTMNTNVIETKKTIL